MVNKSKRNKIKFRSTRKKYKGGQQHYPPGTQENYNSFLSRDLIMGKGKELEFPEGLGGGKGEPGVPPKTTKRPWLYAELPNITEEGIRKIGFELPQGENKDWYKFLEMADRDLTLDMQNKLNKYESNGGVWANYCKYMYLIRATHPGSGNTVLHYICNRRSVEMLKIVFPYYLVLYNADFPELLSYYINKKNKNKEGKEGKTPMELLNVVDKNWTSAPMDYGRNTASSIVGTIKNATQVTSRVRRLGNMSVSGRVNYIKSVLENFSVKASETKALPPVPPLYVQHGQDEQHGPYQQPGQSPSYRASAPPAPVQQNVGFLSRMFGNSSKQTIPALEFDEDVYVKTKKKFKFIYEKENKNIDLGRLINTYFTGPKYGKPAHTTIRFINDKNKKDIKEYKVTRDTESMIVLTEEIISKNQSKPITKGYAKDIFFQEM